MEALCTAEIQPLEGILSPTPRLRWTGSGGEDHAWPGREAGTRRLYLSQHSSRRLTNGRREDPDGGRRAQGKVGREGGAIYDRCPAPSVLPTW